MARATKRSVDQPAARAPSSHTSIFDATFSPAPEAVAPEVVAEKPRQRDGSTTKAVKASRRT